MLVYIEGGGVRSDALKARSRAHAANDWEGGPTLWASEITRVDEATPDKCAQSP